MPQTDDRPALVPPELSAQRMEEVFFARLESPRSAAEQVAGTANDGGPLRRLKWVSSSIPRDSSRRAQQRWLLALLVLGLVLRLTRYLLRFPLWEDEAMLSANLLDRGYAGLLEPLHYCQVAPVLFLWSQLALTKLLGFNEYVLRLVPFLCGLGSLFLFRHVAGRLLHGASLVLAVGLFAVAYPMTRYAAEAKPYGCDLLIALGIIALTIEWLRRPEQTGWLWCLAALIGPAIGFSFPAVFISGGASLVIGWSLWRQRTSNAAQDTHRLGRCRKTGPLSGHHAQHGRERVRVRAMGLLSSTGSDDLSGAAVTPCPSPEGRGEIFKLRGWLPWIVFNALLVAGVVAIVLVSRHAVDHGTQQNMDEGWANAFPPLAQPLRLPLWLLEIHAGAMLGYPLGGPHWGSLASFLCFSIGMGVFVRRRQWLVLGLLLAPLGLNFLAAAAHRFPYGGHARMTLFLAPAFCTFIAAGLSAVVAWIDRRRTESTSRHVPHALTVVLALLALMGGGSWLRDLTQPYKSGTTLRAREFAQWFWFELPHSCELVSCETDMQTDLMPGKVNCGWSALYFCNQRIYSPRHARGGKPDLEHVSTDRPLRCVFYRSPKEEKESPPPDSQIRQHWLDSMQARYALVGHDTYPFAAYDKSDRRQISDDYLEVFTFVPNREHLVSSLISTRN